MNNEPMFDMYYYNRISYFNKRRIFNELITVEILHEVIRGAVVEALCNKYERENILSTIGKVKNIIALNNNALYKTEELIKIPKPTYRDAHASTLIKTIKFESKMIEKTPEEEEKTTKKAQKKPKNTIKILKNIKKHANISAECDESKLNLPSFPLKIKPNGPILNRKKLYQEYDRNTLLLEERRQASISMQKFIDRIINRDIYRAKAESERRAALEKASLIVEPKGRKPFNGKLFTFDLDGKIMPKKKYDISKEEENKMSNFYTGEIKTNVIPMKLDPNVYKKNRSPYVEKNTLNSFFLKFYINDNYNLKNLYKKLPTLKRKERNILLEKINKIKEAKKINENIIKNSENLERNNNFIKAKKIEYNSLKHEVKDITNELKLISPSNGVNIIAGEICKKGENFYKSPVHFSIIEDDNTLTPITRTFKNSESDFSVSINHPKNFGNFTPISRNLKSYGTMGEFIRNYDRTLKDSIFKNAGNISYDYLKKDLNNSLESTHEYTKTKSSVYGALMSKKEKLSKLIKQRNGRNFADKDVNNTPKPNNRYSSEFRTILFPSIYKQS